MKNKHNVSNRWCLLFFLMVTVLYVSCSNSTRQHTIETRTNDYNDTIRRKPPSSFSDTIAIDFPAAVFYNPDSMQLEKIKEITPKNEFESEVHNCFYLMRNARIILKK